jgi:hypothetical protein
MDISKMNKTNVFPVTTIVKLVCNLATFAKAVMKMIKD